MKCRWLAAVSLVTPVVADWGTSSIAAGRHFSLIADGHAEQVVGSGINTYAQLGGGDPREPQSANLVIGFGTEEIVQMAAGAFHSLAVTTSGKVWAVGRNNFGQLGDGTTVDKDAPVEVMSGVASVAAGYAHSVFRMTDGSVEVAGLNSAGQLGLGASAGEVEATRKNMVLTLATGEVVEEVAAGYDFTYVRTSEKKVYATGQNLAGQLGIGSRRSQNLPVAVSVEDIVSMAAGESHGVFVTENGKLYGVGANFDGQAGGVGRGVPVEIGLQDGEEANKVFAGGDSTVFATETKNSNVTTPRTYALGNSRSCQLGAGEEGVLSTPEMVTLNGATSFDDVALGDSHALWLTTAGAVVGVGSNLHWEVDYRIVAEKVCDPVELTTAPTDEPPETVTTSTSSRDLPPDGTTEMDDNESAPEDGQIPRPGPPSLGPAYVLVILTLCCLCALVGNGILGGNQLASVQENESVRIAEEKAALAAAAEVGQAEAA